MKIKQDKNYHYPKEKEIKNNLDELWEQEEMKDIKKIIGDIED